MRIIPRKLEKTLKEVSEEYPVVGIFGPRHSGKMTLAREVFPLYQYVSVGEEDMRVFATDDPPDIGKGAIGIKAFKWIMNDERFADIPKICETPRETLEDDARNVQTLLSLCK